jgi:hypothetical protein
MTITVNSFFGKFLVGKFRAIAHTSLQSGSNGTIGLSYFASKLPVPKL